ncbi:ATP-binding cassette domain-containing protein [Paractinoplanes brasiliensis]|uniref:ABC-2 type transport system ATP-binding protein n=1 Tax=Paractinoplanes brasiliensis TaxID=52695 RepID=A0A4R6JV06_9ACTN|nr:ATP-binding cassette domain-containing protein [Actinoplanes brasiliensis]TDO39672.1 ABC-2 type transport system ATP-binding protein [Actinoplanes brasiliensis]GID28990.1 ABC transporter ATP-binding protein [Actinoplanes brasiliensis]
MSADTALEVTGLTHSFGRRRALDYCSFTVPVGAVTALVGRNGAGKSTLLRAASGLLRPDGGEVRVFGEPAGDRSLPRIGYVAQAAPLYPTLTVAQTLDLGARLNPSWDAAYARQLTDGAALPFAARVGMLAPGHRSRLALVMALAKRPDLLLLDEPLAPLDPVARTEALGTLMADVAERGTTVVLSSHVVADVDGVCDHVVVLAEGRVRLAGEVEPMLAAHSVAVGPSDAISALGGVEIVDVRTAGRDATALIRSAGPATTEGLSWHRPTLEELLLGHLRSAGLQPERKVPA